jgi:ribonuclease HI
MWYFLLENYHRDLLHRHQLLFLYNPRTHQHKLFARYKRPLIHLEDFTVAFFDGASIRGGTICGAGGVIKQPDRGVIRWFINCGRGTNTKAELFGAWVTLMLAKLWDINRLVLLGDSKVIIDWLNQKTNLHATEIEGWMRRTRSIITDFQDIKFTHIFREYNKEADSLSKQGLLEQKGILTYFSVIDGRTGPMSQINLF